MTSHSFRRGTQRRGAIVVLAAFVMILFVAMLAFTIDYGYLLQARTELQRTADAAALAAVQDLLPDVNGVQNMAAAKNSVRSYVATNMDDNSFAVPNGDIEIGRFETASIYSGVTMLNSGTFDTVRVTLRRDGVVNPMERLFFGRALGVQNASLTATATAVLQKPTLLVPGTGVMPFAIPENEWDDLASGDEWSIVGNGQILDDDGDPVPGNWSTVDIGDSTDPNLVIDQIDQGLRQQDLNAMHLDGRISTNSHLDAAQTVWLNSNSGFPSGTQSSIQPMHGQTRIAPLYASSAVNGSNVSLEIVGWSIVTVVHSQFSADVNTTFVRLRKSGVYHGKVAPRNDLRTQAVFDGKYTSPVLVE